MGLPLGANYNSPP